MMEQLKAIFKSYTDKTESFSMKGIKCYCRIVKAYDADTINVILPLGNGYYKFSVRINGIDTCEMKAKNKKNKEYAQKARDRLFELVTDITVDPNLDETKKKKFIQDQLRKEPYMVWIECDDMDKYGRILGTIKKSEESTESFSDILLKEHLAYAYGGATKLTEEEQIKYLES
jgi:endonuclease YncB( thermonuclease family)